MTTRIRHATDADLPAIHAVNVAAFGEQGLDEINPLIDALLADPTAQPLLNLVAVQAEHVVGHVLFTACSVGDTRASILAPLAVDPGFQRQGIAGALVRHGFDLLRERGVPLVFVLGDPGYYQRFGFTPAGVHGLEAPYAIPPEQAEGWMVHELSPGATAANAGVIRCADALMDQQLWLS